MKFGKHLLSVVEEVHPEWAGAFLSYKELKKILGRLEKSSSSSQGADAEGAEDGAAGAGGQTSSEAGLTTLEEDFVRELVAQVRGVRAMAAARSHPCGGSAPLHEAFRAPR